jgi:dimethylglycine dehydrogenase
MELCTSEDLSNQAFPWLTCKMIQLDSAEVLALRVSYAGELGWEIHMPNWQVISIYETLQFHGRSFGLRDFGGQALNSMRMEKMYRAYGHEFTEEISGLEAGMDRFINLDRKFIGSENLLRRSAEGLQSKLAYLVFDDQIPAECFGNEAVFCDGELAGIVTGGAYGHRANQSLAFAYIDSGLCISGQQLTVDTSLGSRRCHVRMDAIYDPENKSLRDKS